MIRRRRTGRLTQPAHGAWRPTGDFHDWLLSLPWVVELPTDGTRAGVRLFAVECEPLRRRRMLVATGLDEVRDDNVAHIGLAAIMPAAALRIPGRDDWVVHAAAPLPADHVLVALQDEATSDRRDLEAFVLEAYCYALS